MARDMIGKRVRVLTSTPTVDEIDMRGTKQTTVSSLSSSPHSVEWRGLRGTLVVALCCMLTVGLSSCVTESTGGIPAPAPAQDRVDAQLDLARGYLERGDLERATAPLSKALKIDSRSAEAHVLYAVLQHAQKEFDVARLHYRTALKIEPDHSRALNNYGTFLYSQGEYEEAVKLLARLVKNTEYSARPQAFENLGLAQLRIDELDAAQTSFERALELNFRQPRSTLELAQLAFDRGEIKVAAGRLFEYRTLGRPTARSLCLGVQVGTAVGDEDQVASNSLALNNLFPDMADKCQTKT